MLWYYTPMALPFTRTLQPLAVVYDCMDELSAFAGAPPELVERERRAASRAPTWCSPAARACTRPSATAHPNVHASRAASTSRTSRRARGTIQRARRTRRAIPRPAARLLRRHRRAHGPRPARRRRGAPSRLALRPASARSSKIDPARAAARANIHYLGQKPTSELPAYLAGLGRRRCAVRAQRRDALHQPDQDARVPRRRQPVVSTPIRDVVRPYGELGLVRIADDVDAFVARRRAALARGPLTRRARSTRSCGRRPGTAPGARWRR